MNFGFLLFLVSVPGLEPFFWIRAKYVSVWRKPDRYWWFDVWDLSIILRFSPLLCCVHGSSSSPPPPVKHDSWQTRPCLPVTLHPRWPEPDHQPMTWGQCQGQGRCFCWELGGREEVAGAIKIAPVMIIIHCLLFLLSSTLAPTPPVFLSSSCQGPTRHVHQLSPGCSESMGSGGRRLVNSPEAAWRSWQLLQLKRTCKHTYSCC